MVVQTLRHAHIFFFVVVASISLYFIFLFSTKLPIVTVSLQFDYVLFCLLSEIIFHFFLFIRFIGFNWLPACDMYNTHFINVCMYVCMYGMRVIENVRVTNTITTAISYPRQSKDTLTNEQTNEKKQTN